MTSIYGLAIGIGLYGLFHVLVWFSIYTQFIPGTSINKSLVICVVLSIPISLLAFFSSKFIYNQLDNSAWAARFISYGTSYLVFPLMTWHFLNETMFNTKTILCIILSCVILYIQIFWKTT